MSPDPQIHRSKRASVVSVLPLTLFAVCLKFSESCCVCESVPSKHQIFHVRGQELKSPRGMEQRVFEGGNKERTRRPVRNKRYSRKAFGVDRRPPKRLFTPEIKRFLKDWLVRRRDNPYPNRDEKKTLAVQTGLTYIQVCNWFANWRRKLKNAGKEPQRKTWGHLIKTYNSQVQGNVEHFSICSEDSIWQELEAGKSDSDYNDDLGSAMRSSNATSATTERCAVQPQCFFISSTTEGAECVEDNPFAQHNKYKSHIMEKYLRDCQNPANYEYSEITKPSMISRWLESAANFKPSEKNYLYFHEVDEKVEEKKSKCKNQAPHGREELDAAEALTTLAFAHNLLKS
ncbi:homeobox protein Mohawk isoform X2 [Atheta coriaria]|uniref:homeobox protein Mohawk isoform X2 n=1 Tax=Dalotia coriaria TaxID=877792 RepID=UPI0031F44991